MLAWSDITKRLDQGFTLIELLVTVVMAAVLLAAFTGFYVSEQRAMRHHQIEVETSQALRTALEQMARDLRSARKDLTRDPKQPVTYPGAGAVFLSADVRNVEFQLDADDSGAIATDGAAPATDEHKGFRLQNASTNLEQYDANSSTWNVLADNVVGSDLATPGLTFTYYDCNQATLATPVASPANIASVGITLTMSRPVIGGLPITRTETETVRLRNKVCP
jgi:prepilin-type N-terminal cleavage/methylation domain-containing protein